MQSLRRLGLALAVLVVAVPALAQDTRGRVQGVITDPSGALVPGVSVKLENDATGVVATRETTASGRYIFDQVDPGNYTITAQLAGFATVVQKNVRVRLRGDVTVDVTLKVSELTEVITVEDSPVGVQFNTAQQDLTIEQELAKQLPMLRRNPAVLARLDPAMNGDYTRDHNFDHYAAQAYDVGGETRGRNDVLIDGSPLTNSAKIAYNPPIDTVAEYTVMTNAVDAEYGHSAGGIITMAMKSGGNEFHGTAYYFGGNPDWNAWTDRVRQSHSENTFWNGGFNVGGPIVKNKVFFFSSYERQNTVGAGSYNQTLPTALERMGDFSQSLWSDGTQRVIYDPLTSRYDADGNIVRDPFPGNVIPQDRWDPLAVRMLDAMWSPNSTPDNPTGLNNFQSPSSQTFRQSNISNRIDWQINDRWKVFGRFSFFMTDQDDKVDLITADPLKMRAAVGSQRDGYNAAADTVYMFNPTTVLTVAGAFGKTIDRRNYPEKGIGEEGYRDLWPDGWWEPYAVGRPIIYFPNVQVRPTNDTFGVRNFWWQQPWIATASARLNKYFGKHSVKVGANVRWKRGDAARFYFANLAFTGDQTQDTTAGADKTTGSPWADFLLGYMDPDTAVRGNPSNVNFVPLQRAWSEMYALYIQDDIKVNEKLTLNLGLRYEYENGYYDPEQYALPQRVDLTDPIPGMQAAIDPMLSATQAGDTGKTVGQIMAESAGQRSHLYNGAFINTSSGSKHATDNDKAQFMPRVGVAYRVDDKTAVRLGYARFYTPPALVNGGNEPLGQFPLGSGFAPTSGILPLVDGVPQVRFSDPFPQGLTPISGDVFGRYTNLGDRVQLAAYERRPPVSDRISLSVQREIIGRTVVALSYFANFEGRRDQTVNYNMVDPRLSLTYQGELNKSVPNPFYGYGTEATFPGGLRKQETVKVSDLLRPYPQYRDINLQFDNVDGKYRQHQFQIRFQRPFHNGIAFLVGYAYNREKSQYYYDNIDQYDRVLTWRRSTNPRHRVVASATWELPIGQGRKVGADMSSALDAVVGGWQLSGTYSYRSGQFLNFGTMAAPTSVTKIGDIGTDGYWFDTTGFDRQPAYTRRTNPLDYDNLTGPNYWNVDLVLAKNFRLPYEAKLQVRLEAYNAFNNMNYANPQMGVTRSDFGQVSAQARGATGRILQYAVRLEF